MIWCGVVVGRGGEERGGRGVIFLFFGKKSQIKKNIYVENNPHKHHQQQPKKKKKLAMTKTPHPTNLFYGPFIPLCLGGVFFFRGGGIYINNFCWCEKRGVW